MKKYYPKLDWTDFVMVHANIDQERWFYSRYGLSSGSLPFLIVTDSNDFKLIQSNGLVTQTALMQLLQAAKHKHSKRLISHPPRTPTPLLGERDVASEAELKMQLENGEVSPALKAKGLSEVVKYGLQVRKLIFIHIGRKGCEQCEVMQRSYERLTWDNALRLEVDVDGNQLARCVNRYHVAGNLRLPITLVALPDSKNTVISQTQGFQTHIKVEALLKSALPRLNTWTASLDPIPIASPRSGATRPRGKTKKGSAARARKSAQKAQKNRGRNGGNFRGRSTPRSALSGSERLGLDRDSSGPGGVSQETRARLSHILVCLYITKLSLFVFVFYLFLFSKSSDRSVLYMCVSVHLIFDFFVINFDKPLVYVCMYICMYVCIRSVKVIQSRKI